MNMRQLKRARVTRLTAHIAYPVFVKPVQKIKVVRKKDGEFFGEFATMAEAEAVIAKAKAQKRASLMVA